MFRRPTVSAKRPIDPPAQDERRKVFRLPGGIPVAWVVLGIPVAAIVLVAFAVHRPPLGSPPVAAVALARANLVFVDQPNGSVVVRRDSDHAVVSVLPPNTNAFVRVMLAGLVRERRREHEGEHDRPFTLVRWSDGRLTLDDTATHRLIELAAFGPDNEAAFKRLLDAAVAPATAPQKRAALP